MKKTITLFLALALTLSLAACSGGGDTAESSENNTATVEQTEPTTTPESEPEVEVEVEPEPTPEPEPELEPEPSNEVTATPIELGGSIDNENFFMTFDSVELAEEFSYATGEHSSFKLSIEGGYQLLLLKGHLENKSTAVINSDAFSCAVVVNDTFIVDGYDAAIMFMRSNRYEIDPYTDMDYYLAINIPDKLAELYETATFMVGFNNDLATRTISYNEDGAVIIETDNLYSLTVEALEGTIGNTDESADTSEEATLWAVDYYVDNFNQPTDEAYVYNTTELVGTFSNSATTNSNLLARMLIDENDIAIMLYEYGKNTVKNSYSRNENYNISMKTADGTIHELTGSIWASGGDRIMIDSQYRDVILDAMCDEPVDNVAYVSFYMEQADNATTNYLLLAPMANFESAYQSMTE